MLVQTLAQALLFEAMTLVLVVPGMAPGLLSEVGFLWCLFPAQQKWCSLVSPPHCLRATPQDPLPLPPSRS